MKHIIIPGQEHSPIDVMDINRVDYPEIDQPCYSDHYFRQKAIHIELKNGTARWTHGCRQWWEDKIDNLYKSAAHLELQARELRREASRLMR